MQRRRDPQETLTAVLARIPAVPGEVFLADCDRIFLERRYHGAVPAVHEADAGPGRLTSRHTQ